MASLSENGIAAMRLQWSELLHPVCSLQKMAGFGYPKEAEGVMQSMRCKSLVGLVVSLFLGGGGVGVYGKAATC